MSRFTRYLSRDEDILIMLQKYIVLVLVFFALAIGGCGSEGEDDPNETGGTAANTGGNSGESNAGNSSEGGSNSEPVSGVDPANPCSDPTIYTLDDLERLKECTSISGDLEVSDDADDVTDLSGLMNLTTVEGDVNILGPSLNSIQGLSNLTTVAGKLTIMTPGLTSLEGLNSLVSVGGLYLNNCAALADLNALSGLTSIDGGFSIFNDDDSANYVLTNLEGLANLTSVKGDIRIFNVRSVPACEVDALCEKLSMDENRSVTICGTAKDECGGGDSFCDIQT